MSINSTTRTAGPYTGTGLVDAYPFSFKVFDKADLLLVQTTAAGVVLPLVLSADYTVTLNADQDASPGGTVKLLAGMLPVGDKLDITSSIPVTQPVSLPNGGPFFAKVVESALDRLTILMQQLGISGVVQALRVPEFGGVPELPAKATRANRVLAFDSVGNPVTLVGVDAGSAAALDLSLRSANDAAKGGGQVGVGQTLNYAANTIGWVANQTIKLNSFSGADPTGATDSSAALAAAILFCPAGGEIELNGFYRCHSGVTVSKVLKFRGRDSRTGNSPDGNLSKSFLYFDTDVAIGVAVSGAVVTFDGVTVSGIGSSSTGDGIRASGVNNSIILTGGSVVQNFNVGVRLTGGFYNKIDRATITFCNTCLLVDGCYNVNATGLTMRANSTGTTNCVTLVNGAQLTMHGGSIESFTASGVGVYSGSSLACFGAYIEGQGTAGKCFLYEAGASITLIGNVGYLDHASNWVCDNGGASLGLRLYSRNNRFVYPSGANTVGAYKLIQSDATAFVDVAGDNWDTGAGVNVAYIDPSFFSGTGPAANVGNFRIQYPANHPNQGKNINTVPWNCDVAVSAVSGTPKNGMLLQYAAQGFAGDDPVGIRPTWGSFNYTAIYQGGQWEKVGLRMPNQVNSVAATVGALVTDFNALLTKLRNAGVMV